MPYDTEVSFVFQNLAGLPWESLYTPVEQYASITEQIGHPIVAAQSDMEFPIFPSGSGSPFNGSDAFNFVGSEFFEKRLTQLDLRFTKILNVGQGRVRVWLDVFNIFNHVSVTNLVTKYTAPGTPYPRAGQVMGGRLFKFGGQFDW